MNKRKLITLLIVLILIGLIVYFIYTHVSITKTTNEEYSDYTPQEEISDEQAAKSQTSIVLYFLSPETNELKSESRLIDANELLQNPYKTIVQNLLNGPTDEKLQKVFPENTRLIDANLTNNCVILNFSEEIQNFKDDNQKYNIINSILNSLAQLNEVNSIKILVNNNPIENMDEEYSSIS